MKCIDNIRDEGTPGFPYNLNYANNKQIKYSKEGVFNVDLVDMVEKRINVIHDEDITAYTHADLLSRNICDPASGFIKSEPHPLRKRNKERSVFCKTIVDQVVARYFLTSLIDSSKSLYPLVEEVIGIGFNDRHATEFANSVVAMVEPGTSLWMEDVSGWDTSVIKQLVQHAFAVAKLSMMGPENHARYVVGLMNYCHILTHTSYVVATARDVYTIYRSIDDGLWCSGEFATSWINSIMRVKTVHETGGIVCRAVGDDALVVRHSRQTQSSVQQAYSNLGLVVRECEVIEGEIDSFSTCSHTFAKKRVGWHCYLDSWPKALYKLLTRKSSPELVAAFRHELGDHPDKERIMYVAENFIHRPDFVPQCAGPRVQTQQRNLNISSMPKKIAQKKQAKKPNRMDTVRKPTPVLPSMLPQRPPPSEFTRALHGHCNPWSNDALGQKVHDNCATNTLTTRSVTRFGLTIGASTATPRAGAVINSNFQYPGITYVNPADAVSAWSSGVDQTDSSYTAVAAIAYSYRLVSWGVRVFCTASYTVAEGHVVLATSRFVSGAPTNAQTQNANGYMDYQIIALRDLDHMWTSKRVDSELTNAFVPMTNSSDAGWSSLTVQWVPGSGAGVTTAAYASGLTPTLQIEIIKNFEIVPLINTIGYTLATASKPESSALKSAIDIVHTHTKMIHGKSEFTDKVSSKVKEVAYQLFSTGLDVFAPRVANVLHSLQDRSQRKRLAAPIMEVD